jgi:WD40 repeat protein
MDAEVILKGFHRRAVLLLAFSPNGKYLASVGQDDDHSVAIWDWRAKTKIYSDKSDKVFGCFCWSLFWLASNVLCSRRLSCA